MANRRKYSDLSFNVHVDIPLYEVLEALSDDDLLAEIKERELSFTKAQAPSIAERDEALSEVLDLLKSGDADEAILVAERFLFPKFASIEACEAKLKEFRAS